MFKIFNFLLVSRVLVLALRPLALLFESYFVPPEQYVLVFLIPMVAIANMLSSLPIYVEYYQSPSIANRNKYFYNLLAILVIFVLLIIVYGLFFLKENSEELLILLVVGFAIEKLADEVNRKQEFEKEYKGWFFVQVIRNIWLLFPFVFMGVLYFEVMLLIQILCCCFFTCLFCLKFGTLMKPSVTLLSVLNKLKKDYLLSYLPVFYLQLPRLWIVENHPGISHLYLIVSQISQGVAFAFNIKYVIPYRKLISHKPGLYFKALDNTLGKVVNIIFVLMFFTYSVHFLFSLGSEFLVLWVVLQMFVYTVFSNAYSLLIWSKSEYFRRKMFLTLFLNACLVITILYFYTLEGYIYVPFISSIIMTFSIYWFRNNVKKLSSS